MLTAIARAAVRRPWVVVAVALLIALLGGLLGASVPGKLKSGGQTTPETESARQYLDENFPGINPNLVVVLAADNVDSPAAESAGRRVVERLAHRSDVTGVQSYWTARPDLASALRDKDRKKAVVLGTIVGDDTAVQKSAASISRELTETSGGVEVRVGGLAAVFSDMSEQSTRDLIRSEAVAIPLTGIVLVLVFGSIVAAGLPLIVGLFAILVTLAVLGIYAALGDVSVFSLNMTTALGFALAVDYSLFIVSRYREELERGLDHADAAVRATQTAGRTVVFSALTVALSLAVLVVFPQYFLRSFAYAGVAVVVAAAAAAIVILPACLVLLGPRVNALDLRAPIRRWLRRPPPGTVQPQDSRWYRAVIAVIRRPIPVALAAVGVLVLLGSPLLSLHFGFADDRVLPTSSPSRQVGDILRQDFGAHVGSGTVVMLRDGGADLSQVGSYAAALSKIDGVPAVLSPAGVYQQGLRMAAPPPGLVNEAGAVVSVFTDIDPFSDAGSAQLRAIREVPSPGPVTISGAAATNEDSVRAIVSKLPMALVLIAVTTYVLLFLFTGSLLLPAKALVLNVLSLSATFGAMVWIFQEGHLSGLLGFTPLGSLTPALPILMFCLAFGVSMDYELFLLSRMREEWLASDRTPAANIHAVAMGVARTGRIFTAAAVLMAIVLAAVATSKVQFMQLFGLGLTLAVLADATIIRLLLVPTLMRLLSTYNWWAPRWLMVLHSRFGFTEDRPAQGVPAHNV
ncbi:MMPL family transporter [Nocardia sp. CDC159]|uniref:MMPL family transporter n=1 Tax=Nocardia pulmonis TaxID=2951408 RepID=A0A9X2E9R6_9NOCA|nr:MULTISPECIES: MMPL family transporter [Nocardia]MCM6776374.1 MMPL family transporter [Nocardia pulmonis]MCM6788798.1 MMPL family transporter [Nocardia sp. CDC159]